MIRFSFFFLLIGVMLTEIFEVDFDLFGFFMFDLLLDVGRFVLDE